MKKDGFVYFILNTKTNCIKIGYSKNVSKRIKQLQTSSDAKLELLYTLVGKRSLENYLHIQFKNCRVSGEWFDDSKGKIKKFIEHDKVRREILKRD